MSTPEYLIGIPVLALFLGMSVIHDTVKENTAIAKHQQGHGVLSRIHQ